MSMDSIIPNSTDGTDSTDGTGSTGSTDNTDSTDSTGSTDGTDSCSHGVLPLRQSLTEQEVGESFHFLMTEIR